MQATVLMATYKRSDILFNTLYSFTKLTDIDFSWELIVVDNADDSETHDVVDRFRDMLPIKLVVETRPGKNNALTSGVKMASGELIILTDDDILATHHWLAEMVAGAKRWPDTFLFGGKVLPHFPENGFHLTPANTFYHQAYTVADWNLPEGPYQPNKVWGPNMAVRSAVFKMGFGFNPQVGPTGKNYIMGSETEFTRQLSEAGFAPVFLPKSVVFHQIRAEQLSMKWILGRAFRAGRSISWFEHGAESISTAPLPLDWIKALIKYSLKTVLHVFLNHEKAIHSSIQIFKILGMVYQRKLLSAGAIKS